MNDSKKHDRREGDNGTYAGEERRREQRRTDDKRRQHDNGKNGDAGHEEVERLKQELETLTDLMKRRQADFENYKKRAQKTQEDFRKFAIKDLALDIVTINDDLLRAIESLQRAGSGCTEDAQRAFAEGVGMISRQIEEMLQKYGIKEIEADNREFNPAFHEAVEIEMSPEYTTDMVTRVHQKGFILDDLVLRSAKVKVAKPIKQQAGDAGSAQVQGESPEGADQARDENK